MPGTFSLCGFLDGRASRPFATQPSAAGSVRAERACPTCYNGRTPREASWTRDAAPPERRSDARNGRLDVLRHDNGIQPDNAIASTREHRITARVRTSLLGVMPAIDLHHEALSGRQEVSDEAPEQRHLAPKHHAEPPTANASPEELFGGRE